MRIESEIPILKKPKGKKVAGKERNIETGDNIMVIDYDGKTTEGVYLGSELGLVEIRLEDSTITRIYESKVLYILKIIK